MIRFRSRLGRDWTWCAVGIGAVLSVAVGPLSAQEQEERELGWAYTAELSLVMTAGNAESSTLGAGGGLRHVWDRSEFRLQLGGVRTESSRTTRTAVGNAENFEVVERSESELTAEQYFTQARYDYLLSPSVFTFVAAGWERNTLAGFDSRITFTAGMGNTWFERENTYFKTDYGLTFTSQNDVVSDVQGVQRFGGVRAGWDFWRRLTSTTELQSVLVVDENLNETKDLRTDFTNSLTLSISDALALRTGLKLLWDNQPSSVGAPLEQPGGAPTGETVLVPLAKLDSQFRVALVASF